MNEEFVYLTPNDVMMDIDHRADRLVDVCRRAGYVISLEDATRVWRNYSDMFAAGWMDIEACGDEEVVAAIVSRCHQSGGRT